MGTGHPISEWNPLIFFALVRASSCSSFEEEIPDGRVGSISTGNHLRRVMSWSDVEASVFPCFDIRFTFRARSAGFTGFRVKYIPLNWVVESRAFASAASLSISL